MQQTDLGSLSMELIKQGAEAVMPTLMYLAPDEPSFSACTDALCTAAP